MRKFRIKPQNDPWNKKYLEPNQTDPYNKKH